VIKDKHLWSALLKAQAAAGGVMKNARNDYAGYDYVSADGMVGQLRHALLSNGLMFTRLGWRILQGSVDSTFVLVHGESGEYVEWTSSMPVVETKGRPTDKAVLAAVTTALSYALRDLLLVARVDEVEVDNRTTDEFLQPVQQSSAVSSLVRDVMDEADRRDDGGVWVNGCIARASAIDGVKYRTLEELPTRFLELMLSKGAQ